MIFNDVINIFCEEGLRNSFICGKVCDTEHRSGWSFVENCTNSKDNMYKKYCKLMKKEMIRNYGCRPRFKFTSAPVPDLTCHMTASFSAAILISWIFAAWKKV